MFCYSQPQSFPATAMWLYSQPCSFACFLEDTQSQKPEKSVSQRNIEIFLELITFQLLKVDFSVAQ